MDFAAEEKAMNVHPWVFLFVLLTIAGELAYIIYQTARKSAEAQRLSIENSDRVTKSNTATSHGATISPSPGVTEPQDLTQQSIEVVLLQQQAMASEQMVEILKELTNSVNTLRDLSSSRGTSGAVGLDQVVEKFNIVTNRFTDILKVLFGQLGQKQNEMLESLSNHLMARQAELYKTLESFSASLPSRQKSIASAIAEPTSDHEPPSKLAGGADEVAYRAERENEPIRRTETRPEPELVAEVKTDTEGFHKLHMWTLSNIQRVMNRSLDQWTKPEELVQDMPANLRYTAQIIDPDSKLLLLGVEGHPEYLALVLPGGYIGSRFYDWFSIPKGTNERIERTIVPAIVQQDKDTFRVSRRGSLAQD